MIQKSERLLQSSIDWEIPSLYALIRKAHNDRARTGESLKRRFVIANLTIDACFTDEHLAEILLQPFAPMLFPAAEGPADIVWNVFLAPVELSSQSAPRPPGPSGIHGIIFASPNGDLIAERRLFSDSVFDVSEGVIYTIYWSSHQLTLYERAKPLIRFFYLLLYRRGILVTHSALVGKNGRGIMVTGRGGVGKTTTCAVSLLNGLDFVSAGCVG